MTPTLLRALVNLAAFLAAGSLLMLLLVDAGTPEFVITVFTLGIGLVLGAVAIATLRRSARRSPHKEDK